MPVYIMNILYIIGLLSILVLFMWKKYTSRTRRRNEYIQYLQQQNQKLQSLIQEQPEPSQSMPNPTNSFSSAMNEPNDTNKSLIEDPMEENLDSMNIPSRVMGIPPEIAFMLHQVQSNNSSNSNVEEVTEDFVDIRDAQEEENVEIVEDEPMCQNTEMETMEDPEKVPLKQLNPLEKDNCEDNGRCLLQPVLEQNFADVPEELYDRPSTRVSENDESGIKAANGEDNRMYLEKDEQLEESLDDLIQTKQMHCYAVLKSGDNKGKQCGKKAKRDGLCKVHFKSD